MGGIRKVTEAKIDWFKVNKLLKAFPGSLINSEGEFVAVQDCNQYFLLRKCETELDIKCKVIERFSRAAFKTAPYIYSVKNRAFNKFMLDGINSYLNTHFTAEDMELIYTKLGNECNRALTVEFINSGYDMSLLKI